MNRVRSCALAVVVLLVAGAARGDGELWTTDFKAAQAQAQKENKDLLLDFTGSDWCVWCKRLHSEVFSKDKFQAEAPGKFVLVELDFPQEKEQPDELVAQNRALRDKYGIKGYPTVLLLDAQGVAYAKTGYLEGGAEAYMTHLAAMQKGKDARAKLLAEADKATGVERARLLEAAVKGMAEYGLTPEDNIPILREISELDADNAAGLKAKYAAILTEEAVRLRMQVVAEMRDQRRFDDAVAEINKIIDEFKLTGESAAKAYFARFMVQKLGGDNPGASESLQKALDADPQGRRARLIRSLMEKETKERAEQPPASPDGPAKD